MTPPTIGSSLGFIPYHLSSFATGYLVAGASLGAAAGALFTAPLTDRFGRKILLITDAAIYAAGSILSALTVDAGMLLASRTLIGLAIGADSAIATAYIAEFAPKSRRGQLSIIQQWMITVGILVAYIIAVIILKARPWQRIQHRLAAHPRPGRRSRPDRGSSSLAHARVAALADAARPVQRDSQGVRTARHGGDGG
jgi:MFS family permease